MSTLEHTVSMLEAMPEEKLKNPQAADSLMQDFDDTVKYWRSRQTVLGIVEVSG